MAGITLEVAQANLDAWLAASLAVARNQSYEIEGRSLTRADAEEIRKSVEFWDSKVKALTRSASGRSRTRYAVLG